MATKEEIDRRVADMPAFEFLEEGQTTIPPSPFIDDGLYDASLAMRTGQVLQQTFQARIKQGDTISVDELSQAMRSVAYVPLTGLSYEAARHHLHLNWKYRRQLS